MRKIPHPWWHWIFTDSIEARTYGGTFLEKRITFITSYCRKCKTRYVERYDENNQFVETTKETS